MLGTLYGTIEVAPTIVREALDAFGYPVQNERRLHRWVTGWVECGRRAGAAGFAAALSRLRSISAADPDPHPDAGQPVYGRIGLRHDLTDLAVDGPTLVAAHAPVAWPLRVINLMGGVFFLGLGLKAYWDHGGLGAFVILAATLVCGWVVAAAGLAVNAEAREERRGGAGVGLKWHGAVCRNLRGQTDCRSILRFTRRQIHTVQRRFASQHAGDFFGALATDFFDRTAGIVGGVRA